MIYLGSDHGGFGLKEKIKKWLTAWGYGWEDLGNKVYDEKDDYPQFAQAVAEKVAEEELRSDKQALPWKERAKGILLCRSAAGMVIAANKIKGIRAVAVFHPGYAEMTRQHNDANILVLGRDWTKEEETQNIVRIWLNTEFNGEERHVRRIGQIGALEEILSIDKLSE